jgi:hypothetical protein
MALSELVINEKRISSAHTNSAECASRFEKALHQNLAIRPYNRHSVHYPFFGVGEGWATIRALLITIAFPGTDAAFALLARICDSELQRTLTGKGLAPEPGVSFDVHFLDPL